MAQQINAITATKEKEKESSVEMEMKENGDRRKEQNVDLLSDEATDYGSDDGAVLNGKSDGQSRESMEKEKEKEIETKTTTTTKTKRRRKRKRDGKDDRNLNEIKKPRMSKKEIEEMSFEEKVTVALRYEKRLIGWKDWCRYCGSRYSKQYGPSPWGDRKLCMLHSLEWTDIKLDLSRYDTEPKEVIDPTRNRDDAVLTQIIWSGQRVQEDDGD